MKTKTQKWGLTSVIALAIILLLYGALDRLGESYVESGFKRAVITFAVARGLNGVISVAQGTEIAIQPAGVGINFTPGQILDPVNDLIERFSWVMLASSTSLGIQKIILQILSSKIFTAAIMLLTVATLIAIWFKQAGGTIWQQIAMRTLLLLLLLRFLIPLSAIASEGIYSIFLEEQYQTSTQSIDETRERINQLNNERDQRLRPDGEDSLIDRASQWYEATIGAMDFSASIERYKLAAAEVSEELIQLIIIFVFQTIMLPLFFLWLMIQLIRRLTRLDWLFPVANTRN